MPKENVSAQNLYELQEIKEQKVRKYVNLSQIREALAKCIIQLWEFFSEYTDNFKGRVAHFLLFLHGSC